MRLVSRLLLLIGFISCISTALAEADKKNILIIRGTSTHSKDSHNNNEVGQLIKSKLETSKYTDQFDIHTTVQYPKDLSLVENADLIIISSDGGTKHALMDKKDPTIHTKHLDSVLKKNKTGLIVIHWATDAPSKKFGVHHPGNAELMMNWIGAVYYWVDKSKSPKSSWTWKFPVLELTANKEHPICNGVKEKFQLQDEYYFNFFTEADGRNPGSEKVTFLHTANAPSHRSEMKNKREQPCYWSFTRENGGRSVAMTSAHMYHTWANPNFFQSFANSIFWTMNMEVPVAGVELETPTLEELLAIGDTAIYKMARHFK